MVSLLNNATNTRFALQVNMKMREITEREHKVKHHPLESPSHQKVKQAVDYCRETEKSAHFYHFFPMFLLVHMYLYSKFNMMLFY